MSIDKIHGEPDAMRGMASEIDEAQNLARNEILKVAAHLEGMPSEGLWDDRNHQDVYERYLEIRSRIDSGLDELNRLALEVRGIAERYEAARG